MPRIRRVFISYHHGDHDKARGFELMSHAPNVDLKFSGRHLLKPVDSNDEDYIGRKIKEEITGSSVTVILVGKDTAGSDWVPREIEWSLDKDPPNGIVAIRLASDVVMPEGLPDHAEVLDWFEPGDVQEFGPAIERAAAARDHAKAMIAAAPGAGSNCGR